MTNRRLKIVLLIILIIAIGILVKSCARVAKPQTSEGAPVDVILTSTKNMPYVIELPAVAESSQVVSVKSLVTGQITKVACDDGQFVATNDLLFEIDARSFEYQLDAAKAALARDQSSLAYARVEEARYRDLFNKKAVSQEQYQQTLTNLETLQATVESDQAAINSAALQIEYSKILAPIDGRLGEVLIDEGNIIEANSVNPLVVINTISPINITFSLPAEDLDLIKKFMDSKDLVVGIKTSAGREIQDGKIIFIDNNIDITSGTIKLKALFPNDDKSLWPGQFIRIELKIYNQQDAVIIPAKAINLNQNGKYVFVVDKDNKAQIREVEIGFSNDNYSVITKGLAVGEQIVINGQLRLSSGSAVVPTVVAEEF
jgi:membrane fusion protein, multidrug efflux system